MIDTALITDRQPVIGATLDDLNMAAVGRHILIAQERGRYEEIGRASCRERVCQYV